ncbi:MAG: type II secretion system protein [Proteobacteria bacterium]|nr:type II secretion system protein [Pseudomonadota bacterium]
MKTHAAGFTMIELVITMTITTIVVAFAGLFIAGPVRGFTDQVRRAELVDSAESSLRRMGRDIRRALPNSVRVRDIGSIKALELLNAVEGIRYRAGPPPGNANAWLSLAAADGAFNTIGTFDTIIKPFTSTTHYLSVYNVGVAGANAYELTNVITPEGTEIEIENNSAGEDRITLNPAFQFAFPSPRQRMYLIDTPVSFLCDTAAGTLTRYSGYAITSSQADRDTAAELLAAGGTAALMSDNLTACTFTYTPGTAQRAGLVSISLTVGQDGENIVLLQQVHIDNVP